MQSGSGVVLNVSDMEEVLKDYPLLRVHLEAGTKSMLAVPLVSNDGVIGALYMNSDSLGAYSDADLPVAMRVSAQISGAIANARLHTALDRESKESEVISEIGKIINSSLNIGDLYRRLTELVSELTDFDMIQVTLLDQDDELFSTEYVDSVEQLRVSGNQLHRLKGSFVEQVLISETGIILNITDIESVVRTYPLMRPHVESGVRSILGVPLVTNDKSIGVLLIHSLSLGVFAAHDLKMFSRVADQISGAIANARLHAALERESKERETLSEIGKILSSSLNIDEAYQRFAELARELIKFDLIQVVLLNQDGENYTNAYMAGDKDIQFDEKQVIALKGTITERLSHPDTGFIINIGDLETGIQQQPSLQLRFDAGVRSVLGVPLVREGNSVGALYRLKISERFFESKPA
jgi:GAF domain-containing protein